MTAPVSRYLALAGPTASGKTACALAIAHHARTHWNLPVEIVSVDSALVYRGMDIGTAKPSVDERAAVPHHLIDVIDPRDSYSAAQFARDAQCLIADIQQRGHLPLLAGGTMLYFKALFDGLSDLPEAEPALRSQLEQEALRHGWPAMHARLATVDPVTAGRLAPNDSQRIGRALEVWHATGKPLSHWHAQGSATGVTGLRPLALISLEPEQRSWLHERIAQRFDLMLQQGFLQEMQTLRSRGDLHLALPSMRCVGYRQAWEGLEAGEPVSLWRDRAIAATRQLAKRQLTWLRSMPWRQRVACDAPDALEQVLKLATQAVKPDLPPAAPK